MLFSSVSTLSSQLSALSFEAYSSRPATTHTNSMTDAPEHMLVHRSRWWIVRGPRLVVSLQ